MRFTSLTELIKAILLLGTLTFVGGKPSPIDNSLSDVSSLIEPEKADITFSALLRAQRSPRRNRGRQGRRAQSSRRRQQGRDVFNWNIGTGGGDAGEASAEQAPAATPPKQCTCIEDLTANDPEYHLTPAVYSGRGDGVDSLEFGDLGDYEDTLEYGPDNVLRAVDGGADGVDSLEFGDFGPDEFDDSQEYGPDNVLRPVKGYGPEGGASFGEGGSSSSGSSTYDQSESSSFDRSESSRFDQSESSSFDQSESSSFDQSESSSFDRSESSSFDKSESSSFDQSESSSFDRSESSSFDKSESSSFDKSESSSFDRSESSQFDQSQLDRESSTLDENDENDESDEDEASSFDKSESSQFDKSESSSFDKSESSSFDKSESSKFDKSESSQFDQSESSHFDKSESASKSASEKKSSKSAFDKYNSHQSQSSSSSSSSSSTSTVTKTTTSTFSYGKSQQLSGKETETGDVILDVPIRGPGPVHVEDNVLFVDDKKGEPIVAVSLPEIPAEHDESAEERVEDLVNTPLVDSQGTPLVAVPTKDDGENRPIPVTTKDLVNSDNGIIEHNGKRYVFIGTLVEIGGDEIIPINQFLLESH